MLRFHRVKTPLLGMARRWMATEVNSNAAASTDKLVLSLTAPHSVIMQKVPVEQVNLPAAAGDMGVLAKHVPSIQQLRPGIVEVISSKASGQAKKYFVSGGFAVIQPDSVLNVNVPEIFTLDQFSLELVNNETAAWNNKLAAAKTDAEKAEAEAYLDVYKALAYALTK